jgi:hypothetical protein
MEFIRIIIYDLVMRYKIIISAAFYVFYMPVLAIHPAV